MELAGFLRAHELDVLLDLDSVPKRSLKTICGLRDKIGKLADLVIVLGDGTMLAVARSIAPYRIPMVGINQGRLGFMTSSLCTK